MFLTAGVRIVASASVALGIGNGIFLMIYLLAIPDPLVDQEVYLTHWILATQIGLVAVGVGLLGMRRAAWIAFWIVGLVAMALACEQARWLRDIEGELTNIPFFVALALMLWFFPSAICLMLPSSRKFYFDEPDQIWMHKKVFRDHAQHAGDVSGRPRKPVGIAMMGWMFIVIAVGVFVYAMQKLAEPDAYNPKETVSHTVVTWLVLASLAVIVSGVGLLRTRRWGWFGAFACALGVMAATAFLHFDGAQIGTSDFLLCVVWCGTPLIYLLVPTVRRPFFSRRRSRIRADAQV